MTYWTLRLGFDPIALIAQTRLVTRSTKPPLTDEQIDYIKRKRATRDSMRRKRAGNG